MRALPIAVAVLVAASGCLSGDDRPDYEAIEQSIEQMAAPELINDGSAHNGSANLRLVGYHSGMPGDGQDANLVPPGGTYNELAVTDEYAYLSRASADGSFGGLVILSHKDPLNRSKLTYVGEFDALPAVDLEVSADETLAFLAVQRNLPDQVATSAASGAGIAALGARGIVVVDIADKTAPTLETVFPLPTNGPHTLTYVEHGGNEYLIACTYDLLNDPVSAALAGAGAPVPGVNPLTQRVLVLQIVRAPPELPVPVPVQLQPVSQYQITQSAPAGKDYFPHDTRVQVHPFTGQALLYVAYWDKGVQILDFTDPTSLTPVGFFTEFGPTELGQIHLAQAFPQPIAGRHITVAEPEVPSAPETGQITFLDTTDPAHPVQLGYWKLPDGDQGPLSVSGFDFSPHNFDTWDGKVALAHNHAGVWVIDVSDEENLRDPKTVAYYMPSKPRDNGPALKPQVWGVFEHHGLLWASDANTGLYVLEYTGP